MRGSIIQIPEDFALIEIMAKAAYLAWKPGRRVAWSETSPAFKELSRREIQAALNAAREAGYRVVRG